METSLDTSSSLFLFLVLASHVLSSLPGLVPGPSHGSRFSQIDKRLSRPRQPHPAADKDWKQIWWHNRQQKGGGGRVTPTTGPGPLSVILIPCLATPAHEYSRFDPRLPRHPSVSVSTVHFTGEWALQSLLIDEYYFVSCCKINAFCDIKFIFSWLD